MFSSLSRLSILLAPTGLLHCVSVMANYPWSGSGSWAEGTKGGKGKWPSAMYWVEDAKGGKGICPSPMALPPPYQFPVAPPMLLQPTDVRQDTCIAYHVGWNDGHAAGYQDGLQEGRNRKQPGSSLDDDESGARSKYRKKTWAAFNDMYQPAIESNEDIFCAKLDHKYEYYPEQIQQKLRTMYGRIQETDTSQQMEYDMTDGWVFQLRLFNHAERDEWLSTLQKHGELEYVGGQWRPRFNLNWEPPSNFDPDVQYRPILIRPMTRTQQSDTGKKEDVGKDVDKKDYKTVINITLTCNGMSAQ